MIALSLACDLTLNDWNVLTLGQISEIIIQKGKLNEEMYSDTDDNKKSVRRVATQEDWDRLGG